MAMFIDSSGAQQQITLHVGMYREAAAQGQSFEQYVNTLYPDVSASHGTAFNQLLASEGVYFRGNRDYGVRPANMDAVLNGTTMGAAIVKEAIPASRILFPAAVMSAIEDKLAVDLTQTPNALEGMIALDDTINGDRYERPVLNFSRPEAHRSATISQLALPNAMLSITASDISRKIPVTSLGLEISEQAVKATTLDLVGLALARQAMVERNERAIQYVLSLLQGDTDMAQAALSSISGKSKKALEFDSTISVAGKLTQKAWIKFMYNNSTKRRISHIVTDLDTAMAIENREGKPIITGDNPNSVRIDAIPSIINPAWDYNTKIFLMPEGSGWPANTIMGLDARYAIQRVKSLSASYEAVENLVMRRATQMRFDSGEIMFRFSDEAYDVMTLTL